MEFTRGVVVRLFKTVAGLRCYLDLHRSKRGTVSPEAHRSPTLAASALSELPVAGIGFVPTMGALHQGHLSLIAQARRENQFVVVSIFVNPLQFGPTEDFQKYPRTLDADRTLCEQAGVDALFFPTAQELGIAQTMEGQDSLPMTQVIPPPEMMAGLCGRSRPGHFQGVATIVTKLLNLVQPDRAYFGQKDAQQLAIIRRIAADLSFSTEIVGCPIVREPKGLACSSRNQYLTPEQRERASVIYLSLQQAKRAFLAGERLSQTLIEVVKAELTMVPEMQPEYVEVVHPTTLAPLEQVEESALVAVAARFGSTRLIDNLRLHARKPIVAIDGPAGAGKSTVARLVAKALGTLYLDTGAMYRALTWLVLQSSIEIQDEPAVAELVSQCEIELINTPTAQGANTLIVRINGQDVTQEIRSLEVTARVSEIAAQPSVRQEMVRQQQRFGRDGGLVAEGRDIGTCVFPDAEVKVFLTASVQERARRRQQDLKNQGKGEISLDEMEQSLITRDQKDSTRAVAPLRKAGDAIEIQTDHLSINEVVDQIVQLYRSITSESGGSGGDDRDQN